MRVAMPVFNFAIRAFRITLIVKQTPTVLVRGFIGEIHNTKVEDYDYEQSI